MPRSTSGNGRPPVNARIPSARFARASSGVITVRVIDAPATEPGTVVWPAVVVEVVVGVVDDVLELLVVDCEVVVLASVVVLELLVVDCEVVVLASVVVLELLVVDCEVVVLASVVVLELLVVDCEVVVLASVVVVVGVLVVVVPVGPQNWMLEMSGVLPWPTGGKPSLLKEPAVAAGSYTSVLDPGPPFTSTAVMGTDEDQVPPVTVPTPMVTTLSLPAGFSNT